MRTRNASLVVGAALVLGSLTGLYVLPAGGWTAHAPAADPAPPSSATAPPSTSSSSTPAPSPTTTPSPTPSSTPSPSTKPTEADLLSEKSFADQSVKVTFSSLRGSTDPRSSVSQCVDDAAHDGHQTLKQLTGHDPVVEGLWDQDASDSTADQVVAVAGSPEDARAAVTHLVEAQASCQQSARGNWVYGPTRTDDRSSTVSSSWMGYYDGKDNNDGRAPTDVEPCGGLLFARNGDRYSIVHVYMCLDRVQLAGLADAAATRLG